MEMRTAVSSAVSRRSRRSVTYRKGAIPSSFATRFCLRHVRRLDAPRKGRSKGSSHGHCKNVTQTNIQCDPIYL
ncbi:hypothetical protein Btru_054306 [Bulinus truncatus]|nr:hypothetical protein Btru_054306 [Bulinus truncatus]